MNTQWKITSLLEANIPQIIPTNNLRTVKHCQYVLSKYPQHHTDKQIIKKYVLFAGKANLPKIIPTKISKSQKMFPKFPISRNSLFLEVEVISLCVWVVVICMLNLKKYFQNH